MRNQTPNISPLVNASETNSLPWLDFASGIMILWMIIYHAISAVWYFESNDYWSMTDRSLLPKGMRTFINVDGDFDVLDIIHCFVFNKG